MSRKTRGKGRELVPGRVDRPVNSASHVRVVIVGALVLAARLVTSAGPQETYRSAEVDSFGRLDIRTADNRHVVVGKVKDQTTFEQPVISASRTAVGATADFPNCCTSYDIPLQLVVYSAGRLHRFTGVGLPIFDWGFAAEGTRVAYGQQTVHFACSIHYELRDIRSERLIDSTDVPEACGQEPNPDMNVRIPEWVARLRSRKKDGLDARTRPGTSSPDFRPLLDERSLLQLPERFTQLLLGIHDDRPVPRHGLFDRPA